MCLGKKSQTQKDHNLNFPMPGKCQVMYRPNAQALCQTQCGFWGLIHILKIEFKCSPRLCLCSAFSRAGALRRQIKSHRTSEEF